MHKLIYIDEIVLKNLQSIKVERKKRGLKQKELAEIIGIKSSTLSSYERGKRYPILHIYLRLCEYFEWDIQNDVNYNFYYKRKNIKRLKEQYFFSVPELSKFSNISRSQINNAIYDYKEIGIKTYVKLIDLFEEEKRIVKYRKYAY